MIGYNVEDTCDCHGWLWHTEQGILSLTALKLVTFVAVTFWTTYVVIYLYRIRHPKEE